MKEVLSFNDAGIDVELNLNLLYNWDESARSRAKEKALFEPNITKQLATSFKRFKREYNIFGKLPRFVVYRLKVY